MAPTATEAEALQVIVRDYLVTVDRIGDVDRIAQRIALRRAHGSRVVRFRRRGRDVYVHEHRGDRRSGTSDELAIYEVGRDGQLARTGTVRKRWKLEAWLREHRYLFEWIAPEWR